MSQPAIAKARGHTANGRAKIRRSSIFSEAQKTFVEILRAAPANQSSSKPHILRQMISWACSTPRPQKNGRERPGALLARRTEEGMEPDDLPCSRNARLPKALVGRASGWNNLSTLDGQDSWWTKPLL